MIRIFNEVEKTQKNFWNGCVFHPTDAVEDPWGKRILDETAADGAIRTVRIYTMFEDIVYEGASGELCYDFRLSDLRLDYLVEKGYDLLLSYAGIPDCIARNSTHKTSVSKNKTRYKGKLWNSSPPKDPAVWEEVCFQYTKHIVERYGLERVKKWRCQCFNEADIGWFFMSELPDTEESERLRCQEYCKMYEGFEKGVRRVSEEIPVGGPALAGKDGFLGGFLEFVKEKNLKLDFISVHHYGTQPEFLNDGSRPFCVANNLEKHQTRMQVIRSHGFGDKPVVVDEWGMASAGFYNKEECPLLLARETEVFSAYFVKLIYEYVHSDFHLDGLMICLSGQHEMTEDFSGFRNFFTLHFIKKPIYNAFVLAAKLHESLLKAEHTRKHLYVLPTKNGQGDYSVLLTYAADYFEEDIPPIQEEIRFDENVADKKIAVWCIDKETTNPYRVYQALGTENLNEEQIQRLREEGKLRPVFVSGKEKISLQLTPNCVYLITVTKE